MAWELSSWLVLTRTFQLVAALAAGSMNGFLIAWTNVRKLGLSPNMMMLELMICVMLVYTTMALIGGRSKRAGWLTFFIVCDVLFVGVDIAIITVLARAGLPASCVGFSMVTPDYPSDYNPDGPDTGYTTTGFSDERPGHEGDLNRFCAFERSCYVLAIGLIFTFIVAIVLSVLRICEGKYTKNTRVSEILESLERANEKEQQSPLLLTTPRFMPPPSEGIITRQTSMRSVATTNNAGVAPYGALPEIPRRPVPNRTSTVPVIPSPINEVSETRRDSQDEEYDALVADGMRHSPSSQTYHYNNSHGHQQREMRQIPMPMLLEENDRSSISEAGMVANGMRYRPDNHRDDDYQPLGHNSYTSVPLAAPPLDEESAALVSDGSRPMPTLPPYSPGGSRMSGQRDNHIASGQALAQDMKPTGYLKQ